MSDSEEQSGKKRGNPEDESRSYAKKYTQTESDGGCSSRELDKTPSNRKSRSQNRSLSLSPAKSRKRSPSPPRRVGSSRSESSTDDLDQQFTYDQLMQWVRTLRRIDAVSETFDFSRMRAELENIERYKVSPIKSEGATGTATSDAGRKSFDLSTLKDAIQCIEETEGLPIKSNDPPEASKNIPTTVATAVPQQPRSMDGAANEGIPARRRAQAVYRIPPLPRWPRPCTAADIAARLDGLRICSLRRAPPPRPRLEGLRPQMQLPMEGLGLRLEEMERIYRAERERSTPDPAHPTADGSKSSQPGADKEKRN